MPDRTFTLNQLDSVIAVLGDYAAAIWRLSEGTTTEQVDVLDYVRVLVEAMDGAGE